jgi:hypothetical protein
VADGTLGLGWVCVQGWGWGRALLALSLCGGEQKGCGQSWVVRTATCVLLLRVELVPKAQRDSKVGNSGLVAYGTLRLGGVGVHGGGWGGALLALSLCGGEQKGYIVRNVHRLARCVLVFRVEFVSVVAGGVTKAG